MISKRFFSLRIAAWTAAMALTACGGGGDAAGTPAGGGGSTVPDYNVRSFVYSDANNYTFQYYYSPNTANGPGVYPYYEVHEGKPFALPFDTALYVDTAGWHAYDANSMNTSDGASPATLRQAGYVYSRNRTITDVSGTTIASAVRKAQDLSVNTVSTVIGVNSASVAGTLPAGSRLELYGITTLQSPVRYRAADGVVPSATTLAQMVMAYPVPASPTAANTVSLGRLNPGNACTTTCPNEALRAAFGPGTGASYYLCSFTAPGTYSACVPAGTGTYATGLAVDGITPLLTFVSLSPAHDLQSYARVFVQRNGAIYYGTKDKTGGTTVTTRFNKVAFEGLLAALGLPAPVGMTATASPYAGTWSASYSGGDTGSCAAVVINAAGQLSGVCMSSGMGGSFNVSGAVTSSGAASFTASGGTSSGATFSGNFGSTTGSGTWILSTLAGTWSALKQ